MTERGVKIGWMKAGMAAVAMVAVMLLVACSSGGDAPEAPPTPPTEPTDPTTPTTPAATSQLEIPIYVSMSASPYSDGTEGKRAARRATAWEPPTGYYLYSGLYEDGTYVNLPNMGQSTIDLFMTYDGTGKLPTDPDPLHARLSYNSSTEKWKLGLPHGVDETKILSGDFYAYGFVPKDAADGAIITKLRPADPGCTWSEGAILTIQGLKAVATDPCVMIGAKHGFAVQRAGNVFDYYDGGWTDKNSNSKYDDGTDERTNRLRAGDFKFHLDTGKTGEVGHEVINPNYLFFLFDHLYSALSISMRVDGEYDKLRHIKLKGLKLRTLTSDDKSPYKANVTITLRANDTGTNPISDSDISAPSNIDYSETDGVIYSNSSGFPLTTAYSQFLGHFMPNGVSTLILTSTYDVYDTKGNLVRYNCSATNTLLISMFDGQEVSNRGWKYKVMLTINPTYLYVMSDPDLDNPTVTVE